MSGRKLGAIAGQWIGHSKGDPSAIIVMDLEEVGVRAQGVAYLFPEAAGIPSSCAEVDIENELVDVSIKCEANHFDGASGILLSSSELARSLSEVEFPKSVEITMNPIDASSIAVKWRTEIGSYGSGVVRKSEPNSRSNLTGEPEVVDWQSFQNHVTENLADGFVFRGQFERWPLQTSFHRSSRRNLIKYLKQDVPRLHRALTGRMKHIFDLERAPELGAFMNLAQHHGFPTPLLDWTYSPFIAAYFAFNGNARDRKDDCVRVLAFDKGSFCKDFTQIQALTFAKPHISFLEALSIENDRSVTQQGLLTLTNLTNIEGYIEFLEQKTTKRYLFALDIPYDEVEKAKRSLKLMGITRTTLFPGIDSICSDLREQLY